MGGRGGGLPRFGGGALSSNVFTICCQILISRPPRVFWRFKRRSCCSCKMWLLDEWLKCLTTKNCSLVILHYKAPTNYTIREHSSISCWNHHRDSPSDDLTFEFIPEIHFELGYLINIQMGLTVYAIPNSFRLLN